MARLSPLRRLRLLPLVYEKIFHYTDASPGEISGFCRTRQGDKSTILVTDVKIFRQEITGADTVISGEALAEFLVGLARQGQNPAEWNLWWHSHHNFGVFWSPTDEATIKQLKANNPIYSLVVNKHGEHLARFDEKGANEEVLGVVMLPWGRGRVENGRQVRRSCRAEVKRLVTEKPITAAGRGGQVFYDPTPARGNYQFEEVGSLEGYVDRMRSRRELYGSGDLEDGYGADYSFRRGPRFQGEHSESVLQD